MNVARVRRGVWWVFAVAVAGVAAVLSMIAAGSSSTTADVVMLCAVVLILTAGIAVMFEMMILLTREFVERIGLNLAEMGHLRRELQRTRDELVALQPDPDDLAEEVASYAVFHCLADGRLATVGATGTAGLEDTGTHNVSRFRSR